MKLKYVAINILGVVLFLGIFLLYKAYEEIEQLSKIFRISLICFPFIFFGLSAIITRIKSREKCIYGKTTWYMFFLLAVAILIYGAVKTFIWWKTGNEEVYSSAGSLTYIIWKDDYIYILWKLILYIIFSLIAGILTATYINIISWITKKLTKGEDTRDERF